jgi:hypothetical protein
MIEQRTTIATEQSHHMAATTGCFLIFVNGIPYECGIWWCQTLTTCFEEKGCMEKVADIATQWVYQKFR